MNTFDNILSWKLKRGSHSFPGSNGGTCINEVAVVAAGFEYRRVRDVNAMPDCFSRPICWFAMLLNDIANDVERQGLLPYAMRLACADSPDIELQREDLIRSRTSNYYLFVPFEKGLEILDEVLSIGRQAEPLVLELVMNRLQDARANNRISKPLLKTPLFSIKTRLLRMV